ncbi:outer membrane protein [Fluoribacter dumoffii]|uniref:outer membrane protein n=1 Tax=Fluoribacter dumoffii TaxID=463 RepID=UPI00026C783F|nr:outer membrane beta-barrel protein [Fluoribacter dumoffii]
MLRKANLLGIASLLLASPCFSGFYVGAGFGPEGAHFTQKAHVVRPGTFNVYDTQHFSGIGVFGTLFGGYGWRHNRYYLAGEINGNLSSVEYKLVNDELLHRNFSKTTFSVKSSEGVSLLPGFFLSDLFLVYGRVGYANGRVKINESDPTIQSSTSNRSGVRYGAGVRYNMFSRWTLMMDYSQINYTKIKSFVFEPFGGVSKSTRIYPNTAQVAFGIIYNFDAPQPVFVK